MSPGNWYALALVLWVFAALFGIAWIMVLPDLVFDRDAFSFGLSLSVLIIGAGFLIGGIAAKRAGDGIVTPERTAERAARAACVAGGGVVVAVVVRGYRGAEGAGPNEICVPPEAVIRGAP